MLDPLSMTSMPTTAPAGAIAARAPRPAAPASVAGHAAHTDFSALMGLQRRGREAVAKLRRQAGDAPAGDPAAVAVSQQRRHAAAQLEQLLERAGSAPGSNARHALARILQSVEQGRLVSGGDSLRMRLAQAADDRRVAPAHGAALRDVIAAIDSAGESTSALANDPTLVQDPSRLATFNARMGAIRDAAKALDTLLASGELSEPVIARLRTAAARENPGHMVRDVLSALRGG